MIIFTKNCKEILVDDDFEVPSNACLTVTSHGYATLVTATGIRAAGGWYKYKRQYLHRYIMDAPDGMQVDHIDGNRLNNTRSNLRVCTNMENNHNKPKRNSNKSGYKGVHRVKSGRWCAQITANYKCRSLGVFDTPEAAALAYNKAARELHGEFAYQNEIE